FWGDPPVVQLGLDPSRAAESAMLQGFIMQGIGDLIGQRFQNPQEFLPSLEQSREQINTDTNLPATQRLLLNGFFNSVESMINSADLLQDDPATTGAGGGSMQFADIQTLDVTRQIDPNSMQAQISKINSRWDISFPQAMLWGVLSCAAGFAISIARERSQGTLTRLQVAPINKSSILAGKALACFATSIAVMALLTVLGVLLSMQPNSYVKLAVAAICVAVAFTGIMMVISVLGKTEQSVSGAGWAIMMIMAMTGGAMIPAMFLPGFLKQISVLSPVKWSIQAIEGAVWRQFSWLEMALPLSVLLATGAVCFIIGTHLLKRMAE
ncbi:MAG: ABC transporter permease, partial [Pirellulaceae bacterium]